MKHLTIITLIIFVTAYAVIAQTNEFTYQGRLNDASMPANGNYDLRFGLYPGLSGSIGLGLRERFGVPVSNGSFSVSLDFPATIFSGGDRYLEISVKPAGSANPYTILTPRQKIASSPYSIRSLSATTADSATNADNANLLNGFSTATVYTPARNIYVSGTSGFLPVGTVNTATIVDGTISSEDLSLFAVTDSKIAANAVTTGKIAASAIITSRIADDSVEESKLDSSMGLGIFSGSLVYVGPSGGTEVVILNGRSLSDQSNSGNSSLTPNRTCAAKSFIAKAPGALGSNITAQFRVVVDGSVSTFGCTINGLGQSCTSGQNSLSIPGGSVISLQVNYGCSSVDGNCAITFMWGMECR